MRHLSFATLLTLSLFAHAEKPARPLPVASERPLPKSPLLFVDAMKGDDRADGSETKPWKTLAHAFPRLKPGDTLVLRGGIYFEHGTVTISGTQEKPITIRAYPKELAILDGGLREFQDHPATAWEPCPDGVVGEYRSVNEYPELAGREASTNVLGRFADSMNPLHGYRFLSDLRSKNEYWNLKEKVGEDRDGIYCGPGLFHNAKTNRIHVRLAHTTLKALGDDNYRGETDPRKRSLVIAGSKDMPSLALRGVSNIFLQDFVVRGSRGPTVEITDSARITIDGLTVYGGASCFLVRDTKGLRVWNTACRGIAAPWTFRGSLKYRAIEARIFSASGWSPTGQDNRDFELAYSEFTDSVDGVFLGNVKGVKFHHNFLDNVSDDGLFLTSTTAPDGTTPGGDVHVYQNLLARCLTTFAFGVGHGRQKAIEGGRQTGNGVFIYRNILDFRRPVMYHIPSGPDDTEITFKGRFASDHGSPAWEPMRVYHNTLLVEDDRAGNYGTHGFGQSRQAFNNIIVQLEKMPGTVLPLVTNETQLDGNLHWSVKLGPDFKGDHFGKFRNSKAFIDSKTRYAPGWTANDQFADPMFVRFSSNWKEPIDLRLKPDSPAIDRGVSLPNDWEDPIHETDKGKSDIGAMPLRGELSRVGVKGRLTIMGDEVKAVMAAFEPIAFDPSSQMVARARNGKQAAILEGYPARDADLIRYALHRQGIPIDMHGYQRGWLKTEDYGKYGLIVVVGGLVRAKVEPNKYDKNDLPRLKKYLEEGGTLFLMRLGHEPFATQEGRHFLGSLTEAGAAGGMAELKVRLPEHPWVKHLDRKKEHTWLTSKLAIPLRVEKGETIIGSATGKQATLYQVPVGKGRLVYLGWEISEFIPHGRMPSTVEQERIFEEQVGILLSLVSSYAK